MNKLREILEELQKQTIKSNNTFRDNKLMCYEYKSMLECDLEFAEQQIKKLLNKGSKL